MAKPISHRTVRKAGAVRGVVPDRSMTKRQAMDDLPPVVYAARLRDGMIKIGWSAHLYRRLERLGGGTQLLGFQYGTYEDEQAIHKTLTEHRSRGREYYHPSLEVMAVVNQMRTGLGLDAVA